MCTDTTIPSGRPPALPPPTGEGSLLRLRPSGRLPSLPPLTGEGSLLRLAGLVIGLWARPPAGRLLPTTINPRPHRHATLNGHSCVSVSLIVCFLLCLVTFCAKKFVSCVKISNLATKIIMI